MVSVQQVDRATLTRETAVDPKRRIIDAHHHLWGEGDGLGGAPAYLFDNLLADFGEHNVVGTIYVESGASFRPHGPEALRPVGETEFAVREAKHAAGSRAPILGVVPFADLMLGAAVQDVLDAHAAAGEGLFRGVRQTAGFIPGTTDRSGAPARNLLLEPAFAEGLRRLGQNGHSFDAFVFHSQLHELATLVRSIPETSFILNHLGVPLNRGSQSDRDGVMALWRAGLLELVACPTVFVKIGGIGMDSLFGMGWSKRERPPGSDEVVAWWGHDIRFCIDTFGPSRCMFESNFPVDRWSLGYTVLWNAFQKIAASYGEDEQAALFSGTAERAYRVRAHER
jgi:predicted TIM-barrel fold metal-dependent hydrolase